MDGDAREGAKQPHCWYCRRDGHMLGQKSEGSTPARLLCHLQYMSPLQIEVLPATHRPDFMWLPWRGNFLPCTPSWHTTCCTSVLPMGCYPCALHWLNSGDGKGRLPWDNVHSTCHVLLSLTKSSLKVVLSLKLWDKVELDLYIAFLSTQIWFKGTEGYFSVSIGNLFQQIII